MRVLLLLSALFTALIGTNADARVAAAPAHQASAAVEAVASHASLAINDRRPVPRPLVTPVRQRIVRSAFAIIVARPLYAGRLRV